MHLMTSSLRAVGYTEYGWILNHIGDGYMNKRELTCFSQASERRLKLFPRLWSSPFLHSLENSSHWQE